MKTETYFPLIIALMFSMLAFALNSCGQETFPDLLDKNGVLLFNSGFEPDSRIVPGKDPIVSDDEIIGKDRSVPPPNDWVQDFSPERGLSQFRFQYQLGDTTKRKLRIVPDPVKPGNNVLSFWVRDQWVNSKGNTVGRIQANIRTSSFASDGNSAQGFREFYQKNRMFVHKDVAILGDYPGAGSFFTFLEVWNNHDSEPYGFRIKLGMGKESENHSKLYFMVSGQDHRRRWVEVWSKTNTTIPIPFGEWVTMEYYVKEGNESSGRFYVAMTRQGHKKQVIFDISNFTHNTIDPDPNGYSFWNPLKVYITNKEWMAFIKSHEKAIQLYFDDLEVWVDRLPPM